jgi:hypothetical protein
VDDPSAAQLTIDLVLTLFGLVLEELLDALADSSERPLALGVEGLAVQLIGGPEQRVAVPRWLGSRVAVGRADYRGGRS